ncbi:MAG: cytosolic protein [Candidatus Eremiobacteraeota bacterium]|nr:cytosolic protein [Candidatus Eremiobacteraeota bacterium]
MARSRGDDGWKLVLQNYFRDFLEFFFPEISRDTQPDRYEFVDGELQSLARRVGIGKRITDKLVKVYLSNGSERWLLVHIEIQGKEERGFEERLFIYSYRIYDRHRRGVATLAVLADGRRDYRPACFEMQNWGCRHLFEFPSVKLLDYAEKIQELEESRNVFAIVVLAHLRFLATMHNKRERLFWKSALVKSLDEKGFDHDARAVLYIFIDWLLVLPEPLEIEYNEDMKRYEKEKNMAYVTSAERIGRKQGRKEGRLEGKLEGKLEGRLEGKLETASNMFKEGFNRETVKKLTGLTDKELDSLTTE